MYGTMEENLRFVLKTLPAIESKNRQTGWAKAPDQNVVRWKNASALPQVKDENPLLVPALKIVKKLQ